MSIIRTFCGLTADEIKQLQSENKTMKAALGKIVNNDVYSYLPNKAGVKISMTFDDLESIRFMVKS
jgi:hypothetical protein